MQLNQSQKKFEPPVKQAGNCYRSIIRVMAPLSGTILSFFIATVQGQILVDNFVHRKPMFRQAHFMKHRNRFLNVTPPIVSINVMDNFCCIVRCLSEERCFSFNLAIKPISNLYECQLLPTDKYNSSRKFENSKDFHHYSIEVSMRNGAHSTETLFLCFTEFFFLDLHFVFCFLCSVFSYFDLKRSCSSFTFGCYTVHLRDRLSHNVTSLTIKITISSNLIGP